MKLLGVVQRGGTGTRQAHDSTTLRVLVRLGLAAYGLVHLLIAWLALQIAWTHADPNASNTGAVHTLASQPFGRPLLWICVLGFAALTAWQALEAWQGHTDRDDHARTAMRAVCVARAVLYAALAVLFAKAAAGHGGSSGTSKRGLTARLLHVSGGQVLVTLIGLAIFGVGVGFVVVAVRRSFEEHLGEAIRGGRSGEAVVRLGQVGYTAKGVALGVVGGLFVWAAWSHDARRSGGLDSALHTVQSGPYGHWLLSLIALGLACFGLYCFAWARDPEVS